MKTVEEHFADWEAEAFGFGYGTGEEHVLGALKSFLAAVPAEGAFDYGTLEKTVGAPIAWLLINTLCRHDVLEYGTSPRFAWLTDEGRQLKRFVGAHQLDELVEMTDRERMPCYRDHCNCDGDEVCHSPFWRESDDRSARYDPTI